MARKSNLNTSLRDIKFHSVSIIDKNGKAISIAALWNVINLHESIFRPVITGNIAINDTVNLRASYKFAGEEQLYLSFSKPSDKGQIKYSKIFRITKIESLRKNDKGSGASYILRFCSDELFKSKKNALINRTFEGGSYSEYVNTICLNDLSVNTKDKRSKREIQLEQSYGPPPKHIITNLTALEAIEYFERRAINEINSPFLFFENNQGYNFVSLSRMTDGVSLVPGGLIVSTAKNSEDPATYVPVKANEILNFNVDVIYDLLKFQKNLSGSLAAFDILKGSYNEFDSIGISQENLTNKESAAPEVVYEQAPPTIAYCTLNRTDMQYNSTSFATNRIIAGQNISPYTLDVGVYRENNSNEENFLLQRKKLLNALEYTHFNSCEVAGNPSFTVGIPVDINVPALTSSDELKRNMDPYLSGRYIITKVRHNLTKSTGLRTFISVASNSPGLPLNI